MNKLYAFLVGPVVLFFGILFASMFLSMIGYIKKEYVDFVLGNFVFPGIILLYSLFCILFGLYVMIAPFFLRSKK